jgi:hypothetical protein
MVDKLKREAEENRRMREKLELDLIGTRAWIRSFEEVDREYRRAGGRGQEGKGRGDGGRSALF